MHYRVDVISEPREKILHRLSARTLRAHLMRVGFVVFGGFFGLISPVIVEYLTAKFIHRH